MRVRIRRFRSGDQGCPPSHGMIRRSHPKHPMLPNAKALIGSLAHAGVIGPDVLSVVGCPPTGSALPVIESSGESPARPAVLWPLLTSRGISSAGSPQVRTRCVPARPPHLPPRLNPRLHGVVPTRRLAAGLGMRFLFVGPPVSPSLPPAGWLPFQRWLRVVVCSRLHVRSSYRGLSPHLQRAHAGRTQAHAGDVSTRAR